MKTVQLQIDDRYLDSFLSLINNLKDGMIQNVTIDKKEFFETDELYKSNKKYFQKELQHLEKGTTKVLSHDEAWANIYTHIEENS